MGKPNKKRSRWTTDQLLRRKTQHSKNRADVAVARPMRSRKQMSNRRSRNPQRQNRPNPAAAAARAEAKPPQDGRLALGSPILNRRRPADVFALRPNPRQE